MPINPRLVEIISLATQIPEHEITGETGPSNREEWDSLAHLTIITSIESEFKISMSMSDMLSIKLVSDLQAIISSPEPEQ